MSTSPSTPRPRSADTDPDVTEPTSREPVGPLALAIDIGGTKMAVGLATRRGVIVDRDQVPTDLSLNANDLFASLAEVVNAQCERAKSRHGSAVVTVGIGSAGPVADDFSSVSPLNIPAWREFDLRTRVRTLVKAPTFGDLDAKAFALGEGWLGAAKGKDSFLALTVGTGVGGGVVLDGRLLDGASGNAGHIGHMIVVPNGRRCACGSRGCLEAEASGSAIESITGRSATEPSYEVMQRTGHLVGIAVASACNLLDVDLAVIGGSVALGFASTFFTAAQATVDERCQLAFSRGARVVPARLGDLGPLVGASAVGWRGLHRMSARA